MTWRDVLPIHPASCLFPPMSVQTRPRNGIDLDPNTPGTKTNPREALYFVYERSEIVAGMLDLSPGYINGVAEGLTTVHPNAVDVNQIVDWTLRKFSELEIENKMLLLQYSRLDWDTPDVAERRKLILGIANELSLKVIDTYDVLRKGKENELWYPEEHHTPLGNEVVCSYLFEQGFPKADAHI
jgi:hypothetical protein